MDVLDFLDELDELDVQSIQQPEGIHPGQLDERSQWSETEQTAAGSLCWTGTDLDADEQVQGSVRCPDVPGRKATSGRLDVRVEKMDPELWRSRVRDQGTAWELVVMEPRSLETTRNLPCFVQWAIKNNGLNCHKASLGAEFDNFSSELKTTQNVKNYYETLWKT